LLLGEEKGEEKGQVYTFDRMELEGGAGKENAVDYMNAHYRTIGQVEDVREEATSDNERHYTRGAFCVTARGRGCCYFL